MANHAQGASAPIDISIVSSLRAVYAGANPYYVIVATEDTMRASGLIFDERVYPSPKMRSCRKGYYGEKCSRLGDGRLRLLMNADLILSRDAAFKRFLGGLLSDTSLSLVKDEPHE